MKRKVQEYFFYFMLYSILGWIYEVFLEVVIYKWGFSNRGVLFGPYCVIYGVGALVFDYFIGKGKTKSGTYWEMECDADFDFYCNHRNYYSDRIDWKLYYGIHKGRMAVGLYEVPVQLSGAYCLESKYPFWNRRYDFLICVAADFCQTNRKDE